MKNEKEVKLEDLKVTREIIIVNDKLNELLVEKNELVQKGRKYQKEIEAIQKKQNKIGLKLNKIKEKIIPSVEELTKDHEMGQWEIPMTIAVNDKGESVLTLLDKIEKKKQQILESLNKEKEDAKTDSDPRQKGDTKEPV